MALKDNVNKEKGLHLSQKAFSVQKHDKVILLLR